MNAEDCIFCKIASGEIATDLLYESDDVIAFNDLAPQAPTHVLIIPRQHIATINDIEEGQEALIGKMYRVAKQIAKQRGIDQSGYRLVMNCNEEGGQSVYHIHLHLLGGRQCAWPPG